MFTKYVTRRTEIILNTSCKDQWSYISSSDNPANFCTRPRTTVNLINFSCLSGPVFLQTLDNPYANVDRDVALDNLPEECEESSCKILHTNVKPVDTNNDPIGSLISKCST